MGERPRPARDTITLGRFIEGAANASGGKKALSRRLGLSRASVERMSVSGEPLLADDAQALLEVSGLSSDSAAELPVRGPRRGASARD